MSENAKATRTKVSKAHKAIQPFVAIHREWKGRKVTLVEAGPEWVHVQYHDDTATVAIATLDGGAWNMSDQPRYGGPGVVHRAVDGHAVVMLSRFMGQDMGVEIIIPAGAIDAAAVAIAVDALLERTAAGKRKAIKTLEQCGAYAGIAMALAEACVKARRDGEDAISAGDAAMEAGRVPTAGEVRSINRRIAAAAGTAA